MLYKIEFSQRALGEISEAFAWYELQSSGLGNSFMFRLEKAINKISTHPTHFSFIENSKTIRDL